MGHKDAFKRFLMYRFIPLNLVLLNMFCFQTLNLDNNDVTKMSAIRYRNVKDDNNILREWSHLENKVK